jgi:hypothetical protein
MLQGPTLHVPDPSELRIVKNSASLRPDLLEKETNAKPELLKALLDPFSLA